MLISIFGGGPAGMMAADALADDHEVHIYEKGKALGRKFLVAGKGGFNLSHNAEGEALYARYTPCDFMRSCLEGWTVSDTRAWLAGLGIPTFVGSSGRIFPERGIKPVRVLAAIRKRLVAKGVQFHYFHEFVGFAENMMPLLRHGGEVSPLPSDRYVFALGGASWSVTGSAGDWLGHFDRVGVRTMPFQPSNCGLEVHWEAGFLERNEGRPLKNIAVRLGDFHLRGEAVVSRYGLEGNAIYPLSAKVRGRLDAGAVTIGMDFKPTLTLPDLERKIAAGNIRTKDYPRLFHLDKTQLGVIKQCSSKEEYLSPRRFIRYIKDCPIPVRALRPLEEAISTVGGIATAELAADFSLRKYPNIHVVGEMVDWDAPTGGFLLQGCFGMGRMLAAVLGRDTP